MGESLFGKSGGGLAGGLSSGVKMAAIALLIHQLMKHSRGEAAPAAPQPEGGGLGGLLGGLFGGGASAGGQAAGGTAPGPWGGQAGAGGSSGPWGSQGGGLGGLLGGAGGGLLAGLGGLLAALRSQGFGRQVDSWIAPGPNQPVSAQELERSFDPQELDEAARRAGTDRGTLLQELSAMLPQAVDRMTPQGRLPEREEELGGAGLGGLLSGLFGGDREAGPQRR